MAELFERIDSVADTPTSERVNGLARSNTHKRAQSFSDALKKKLNDEQNEQNEQDKKEDELILEVDGRTDRASPAEPPGHEVPVDEDSDSENESSEHIDIKV